MKAVVTGAPRSGTTYLSKVLQRAGVSCGHEDVYHPSRPAFMGGSDVLDGDVSWFATFSLPIHGVPVGHQVRNPYHAIPSIASYVWSDAPIGSPALEFAAAIWLGCTQAAQRHSAVWWRVEDLTTAAGADAVASLFELDLAQVLNAAAEVSSETNALGHETPHRLADIKDTDLLACVMHQAKVFGY